MLTGCEINTVGCQGVRLRRRVYRTGGWMDVTVNITYPGVSKA